MVLALLLDAQAQMARLANLITWNTPTVVNETESTNRPNNGLEETEQTADALEVSASAAN